MQVSLITKLTLSTSAVLLVTMSLFAYLNIDTLEKMFLEEAILDADKLSATIIQTTHYQMLENDRKRVFQMIQEVGSQQKEIEHIRMINKDGLILFSTEEREIGGYLDKSAAACNMCHSGGSAPLIHASSMNRSRIFRNEQGKQVLGLAKAIYNEESCFTASCHYHPPTAKVLGVLDVIVSLDNMRSLLESYRYRIGALTSFLLFGIWGSLTIFTHRLVNRPIRRLSRHVQKFGQGELDSTVDVDSGDELGELANAFNLMTKNLKKARTELEESAHTLEQKVEERTRELTQMQNQLIRSEKLASLGELVAGIAHEINNPLTGILMFASLAARDKRLDPTLQQDMEVIVRETRRCASIVQRLLEFSRESAPRKTPSSVNSIMENALSLVCNQAFFQDINVVRDFAEEMPEIPVDPNQIEQVFINMVLNAAQAMNGMGELRLKTDAAGETVVVTISDTGCGIPEENLVRIFDPFFTTKESSGTGLGLSVSYGIIERHGGEIEVESMVGTGTTFRILLPVLPHDKVANAEQAEPPQLPPV